MPPVDKNVTFRSLLSGEVSDFLGDEGIESAAISSSIVAVASRLTGLREEGQPLSPEVYFCSNVEKLAAVLQGSEVVHLGQGPQEDKTVLRALKECAPLANGGWVIFIDWNGIQFRYGVMTQTNLPLSITPYEALVENAVGDVISIVVRKIADSCVELQGGKGNRRCLYFSDRRAETAAPAVALENFCKAATRGITPDQREDVRRFYYRTLTTLLANAHGAIFVVQSARRKLIPKLSDSTRLPAPLSIVDRVNDYLQHKDNEALSKLSSAASLIQGMLGSDGIVVFTSSGTILAYRAFLKLPAKLANPVTGGARRRTFEALRELVGRDIEAVFIASHDGQTEFAGDDDE